jgi:hypothetical protein
MGRNLLLLLILLRLLWPPGLCACQFFHLEEPPQTPADAPDHNHDEHPPGCPGSKTASNLWIARADPPPAPDLCSDAGLLPEPAVLPAPAPAISDRVSTDPDPGERPLYVTLRALLI